MKGFYQKISNILEEIVRKEYGIEAEPPLWELPSRQEFGDLSSMISMKLASKLKKPPFEIACQIKSALQLSLGSEIEKIEIIKPAFINIFISRDTLITALSDLLENKENFFRHKFNKKIILEFVSANPTGPLSIAHGRQAVVGDVIGNILDFFGNNVNREYYVNNEGRQIDLLVESIDARAKELKKEEFIFPEAGYQGDYIKDIAKEYLDKGKGELREFALSHMLFLIERDLASLGIRFNTWFSQHKLIAEGKVQEAIDKLRKKEIIYEKEGALWFSSTQFGDDKDRVVKKSDGELTYFASDIAYHKDKLERGAQELINLWGPDHHGYIARVKAAIKALGCKKEILNVVIIQLVSIKTKERMSRRKGTAILLSDLVKDVGKDAARFYYLVRRNSSHLEFDVDLAKEASFNNSLYYIQYASARIESIFKKAQMNNPDKSFIQFLKEDQELELLRVLLQFFYCLEKAYYSLEPVFIIEYLKGLAAALHKFYETTKVVIDDRNIMSARLNLLMAVKIVLHCALSLLGITPAEEM